MNVKTSNLIIRESLKILRAMFKKTKFKKMHKSRRETLVFAKKNHCASLFFLYLFLYFVFFFYYLLLFFNYAEQGIYMRRISIYLVTIIIGDGRGWKGERK